MEIIVGIFGAVAMAILIALGTRIVLHAAETAAWLIYAVRTRDPRPRPSMAQAAAFPILASLGAGVVAGIVVLASPRAKEMLWASIPFVALAALVPAGAVGLAGRLYERRSKFPTADKNACPPRVHDDRPAAVTPMPPALSSRDVEERVTRARESEARFVGAFRPQGAPEYVDLLYGQGESRAPWFTPSAEQLGRCLGAYEALLHETAAVHPMFATQIVSASELCLAYLDRAWHAGVPLPAQGRSLIALLARVETQADAMLPELRGDWRDRLRAIADLLDEMAAGHPPRAR